MNTWRPSDTGHRSQLLNNKKIKSMMSGVYSLPSKVYINQKTVEVVDNITCLVSSVGNNGDMEKDCVCDTREAAVLFKQLNSIWKSKKLSLEK